MELYGIESMGDGHVKHCTDGPQKDKILETVIRSKPLLSARETCSLGSSKTCLVSFRAHRWNLCGPETS